MSTNQLITVDSDFMRRATIEREQLITQRDQLLSAAKAALQRSCFCKSSTEKDWHSKDCAIPALRAAIAAAEAKPEQAVSV